MTNEKCQMSKFKIQMADDGVQTTGTKLKDTDHGHESQCQSLKLGMPRKPEKRTLSEGECGQQIP